MATTIVTLKDIEHLSERLLARSRSRLNEETSLANDLLLAGRLLARFCRDGTDLGLPINLNDD
jgi:hypothetical protein